MYNMRTKRKHLFTILLFVNEEKVFQKVLDYKLFQSIDVSTYWHLYNFFDGANASWKEARNQDIFYFKGSKRFFRKFRRAGYLTAYSWDLCYSCIWRGPYWGEDFLRKKFSRVVGMSGSGFFPS